MGKSKAPFGLKDSLCMMRLAMKNELFIGDRTYEISLPGYAFFDEDMIVYRDCVTKVKSVRFVKIDTDNELTEDAFKKLLVGAYLDNHDDSTDCVTVEINLSGETKAFLDEICNTCEISIYAFAKGMSKFLCNPEKQEKILKKLENFEQRRLREDFKDDIKKVLS